MTAAIMLAFTIALGALAACGVQVGAMAWADSSPLAIPGALAMWAISALTFLFAARCALDFAGEISAGHGFDAGPERRTFAPSEICGLFRIPAIDPWADLHQAALILWSAA